MSGDAGVKLRTFVASYVAGLKTALICPFVQALFHLPNFLNGQHAAPVLPEITIGQFWPELATAVSTDERRVFMYDREYKESY